MFNIEYVRISSYRMESYLLLQNQLEARLCSLTQAQVQLSQEHARVLSEKAASVTKEASTIQILVVYAPNFSMLMHSLHRQEINDFGKENETLKAENSELKLEILRWRKKASMLRLRLASSDEDLRMLQDNQQAFKNQLEELMKQNQEQQQHCMMLTKQLHDAQLTQQGSKEEASKQQV